MIVEKDRYRSISSSFHLVSTPSVNIPAPREFLANFCEFGRRIWYIHDWPSTCEYGGWTPWQSPCRRCCSGTAGSSPAPPERRDSSGVAANSTVGWRPARSPVNGTCTVVHLRSDIVRRIRISCGCARAYVNCVTVDGGARNGGVHARSGNSHWTCHDFPKNLSKISQFFSPHRRTKSNYFSLFEINNFAKVIGTLGRFSRETNFSHLDISSY